MSFINVFGNIKAIKQLRINYRGLNLTKMVRVVFVTMRTIPFTQISKPWMIPCKGLDKLLRGLNKTK